MERSNSREKRWIVLSGDGRHATLGRHTDPSEQEIQHAAMGLRAAGVGGWLAVTEGGYYARGRLAVMNVREIEPSCVSFDEAVRAFLDIRATVQYRPQSAA